MRNKYKQYNNSIFVILQSEISSLKNLIFSLFQTGILQTTAGRKIQFKLGKKSVHQSGYFKLENCKNQLQIDRGLGCQNLKSIKKFDFVCISLSKYSHLVQFMFCTTTNVAKVTFCFSCKVNG